MRPSDLGTVPARLFLRFIPLLVASWLLSIAAIPPSHADSVFTREIVDFNPELRWLYEVSYFDVAQDAQGVFHFVIAEEDALGYLRLENGERTFMEIDAELFAYRDVDIVVESDGTPHLIYIYGSRLPDYYRLRHAVLDGGSWVIENIDYLGYGVSGAPVPFCEATIDAEDELHVVYAESHDPRPLLYATNTGGTWTTEIVYGQYFANYGYITIDDQGAPHVIFNRKFPVAVVYAERTTGSWNTRELTLTGIAYGIAIDPADRIHTLITGGQPQNGLRWAVSANGIWSTMNWIVPDLQVRGADIGLIGNWPVAAYSTDDGTDYRIHYSEYDGSSWTHQLVAQTPGPSSSQRLIRDSQNKVHIFNLDDGLRHISNEYGPWYREYLAGYLDVGRSAQLRLDNYDDAHLAYVLGSNGSLNYASDSSGQWRREIVDAPEATPVAWASLALAYTDQPRIAYTRRGSGLHYASRTSGQWWSSRVFSGSGLGMVSLDMHPANYPRIAFQDSTDMDLRYAWNDGGSWSVETVDESGDVGDFCALDVDYLGYTHIAYLDRSYGGLKYAKKLGASWSITSVLEPDVRGSISIVTDGDGLPHISFDDDGELAYAHFNGTTWEVERVQPGVEMTWGTAITVDEQDRPRIVAGNLSRDVLEYFVRTDHGWMKEAQIAGTGPALPQALSLEINSDASPHILYANPDAEEIRLNWRLEETDLAIVANTINLSRTNAVAGESLTVSPWTLANIGGLSSRDFHFYYMLTDDPGFAVFRQVLDSSYESVMGAYTSRYQGVSSHTIPLDVPNGQHYMGIIVDWSDIVDERSETNNTWYAPLEVYEPVWTDATTGALGDPGTLVSVSWVDFDNDADLDIYRTRFHNPNELFRNDEGVWVSATPSGLDDDGAGGGISWADFDNDGDADLFFANKSGGNNHILRNNGAASFTDITPWDIGAGGYAAHTGIWGDYDLDGFVDLLLIRSNGDHGLYRNLGDGSLEDLTPSVLADHDGAIRNAAWVDYDHDGDGDIYLVKYNAPNRLLRNDGGGVFTEAGNASVQSDGPDRACAWADFDDDGDEDVYLLRATGDVLLENQGGGNFGPADPAPPLDSGFAASATWADYDNDGDQDLFLAGGDRESRLWRNDGAAGWEDVAPREAGAVHDTDETAWADYDRDGKMDLLKAGFRMQLLHNEADNTNEWIQLRLQGTYSNRDAFGARVVVVANGQRQYRQVQAGGGGLSQGSRHPQFGVGSAATVDSVIVYWPSRQVQVLTNLQASFAYSVVEPQSEWVDVTVPPLDTVTTVTGVAWVDHDGDGDLDLYLAQNSSPNVLMDNLGAAVLSDVSAPPLDNDGADRAVSWGDYDNDGDPDLYLALLTGPNKLLRNEGGGVFVDVTTAPLDVGGYTPDAEWVDTDNDGYLDLYVVNGDGANLLFHNEGDGSFTDSTSGPLGDASRGNDSVWCDYDDDGDQDLYLVNYEAPNRLLRNEGNDVFVDVTSGNLAHVGTWGVAVWGDYDNDRDFDLYLSITGSPNYLFRNDGGDSFHSLQHEPLNDAVGCRGLIWGDYDNDGDLDLFMARFAEPNQLLRNDGGSNFTVVQDPAFQQASPYRGNGSVFGDYDADGDLDLFVAGAHQNSKLVRNFASGDNHWLQLRLFGTVSNASAIGAYARIVVGGQSQIRQVGGDTGYGSQSSLDLEFGLGTETIVDSLIIRWPSGVTQTLVQLDADQLLEVREVEWSDVTTSTLGITGVTEGASWADYDGDGYDDLFVGENYRVNDLLHNDQNGGFNYATPAAWTEQDPTFRSTWGDYDNDGDLDLYLSNQDDGMFFPGIDNILYRNDGGGAFTDVSHAGVEWGYLGLATDAGWFDCDNDGDLDLAMISAWRANRVAQNAGGDTFLPLACGDLAITSNYDDMAFGDYDNDGDLDVYMLMSPGNYNRLLRNEGAGVFVDATAGELLDVETGMACAWGDVDNDSDLDLYITYWFLPNKLLRNDGGGVFTEATPPELAINDPAYGFTFGDFDNNGHLDLYVPGWNTTNNHYLLNQGGGVWEDAAEGVLATHEDSHGAVCTDYDLDGDLDLYIYGVGANQLLRNELRGGNHWLQVDLIGTISNRTAIGARVWLVGDGFRLMREVSDDTAAYSEGSRTLEFGLGEAAFVDSLIIRWPLGHQQVALGVVADQRITATEYGVVTGVETPDSPRGRFALHPAVPNPFNPSTTISYELPESLPVQLRIYSVSGRLLKVLRRGEVEAAGLHSVIWRGLDEAGARVASGVYFYRLEAGPHRAVGRMTLLK